MRLVRTALAPALLALPAAAALPAGDDPWAVPAPEGIDLMLVLTNSKRDYTLMLEGKPWEGADGPAAVELPLPAEEKEGLARARDLAGKGDAEGAAKEIDALLAKNPANWDAHLVRAKSLHAAKSPADALAALRTSLLGNRRNPEAWKLLDEVAKALSKKVVRPALPMRGWVRELAKGAVEVGHVPDDPDGMPWNYYGTARAVYRWEGTYAQDFPSAKDYRFSFREQMYAMGVLATSAENERKDGTKLSAGLKRVLAERAAGTLPEFTWFAVYPEPLPAQPEPGIDVLRPRLEKYFDTKIVVKK